MSELVSRRRLLSTCGALGIGSLAGCSGLLGSEESNGSWPMTGYGPGNTAFNPSASGPKDSLSEAWSVSAGDLRSDAGVEQHLTPHVSPPVVADGSIFVASWEGISGREFSTACHLHKIADDGEIAWSSDPLTSTVIVAERPVSLAVVSGTVYVVAPDADHETGLWALDAESGDILWEHEKYALGDPIVRDGEVIVQGNTDIGTVYATSTDGSHAWTFSATTADGDVVPADGTGAADGERTYVPMYGGGIVAVDRSGERDWYTDEFLTDQSGERAALRSIVAGDSIYASVGMITVSDGKLVALDPTDGSVRWEFKPDFDAERRQTALENVPAGYNPGALHLGVYGKPALADGTVYMFGYELTESDLGEWWHKDTPEYMVPKFYALSADSGDVEWTVPLDGLYPGMFPIVADGTIYLSVAGEEEGQLLAIDADSGDIIDRMSGYPSVVTGVAVAGERLYVSEFSGDLLAVGPT